MMRTLREWFKKWVEVLFKWKYQVVGLFVYLLLFLWLGIHLKHKPRGEDDYPNQLYQRGQVVRFKFTKETQFYQSECPGVGNIRAIFDLGWDGRYFIAVDCVSTLDREPYKEIIIVNQEDIIEVVKR